MKRVLGIFGAVCLLSLCALSVAPPRGKAAAETGAAYARAVKAGNLIAAQYDGVADATLLSELKSLLETGGESAAGAIERKTAETAASAKSAERYNFQIISDPHMSLGGSMEEIAYGDTYQYFTDALRTIALRYADTSGVLVPGDVTCHGDKGEHDKYLAALRYSYDELGLPLVLTAIGNHEYYNEYAEGNATGKRDAALAKRYFLDSVNSYYREIGFPATDTVYYDTYIGGSHFIVLGSEQDGETPGNNPYCYAYLSDEQLAWFEEKMAETDPSEPVFVMLHQPLDDTVHLSSQWGAGEKATNALKRVLLQHPQAVLITGHVHNGLIGEDAVYNGGFGVCVDMPAFQYNDVANTGAHIGYTVSVYADRTIFTPIDFDTRTPLYTDSIKLDLEFAERLATCYDLEEVSAAVSGSATVLDLGTATSVDGVRVLVTSGTASEITVEGSSDGAIYTTLYSGALAYPDGTSKVSFPKTDLRYLRCTVSGGAAAFKATWYGEDKSELRALYRKYRDFDPALYRKEKADRLNEALAEAKAVIEDRAAARADIDTAASALAAAAEDTIAKENESGQSPPPESGKTGCGCGSASAAAAAGVLVPLLGAGLLLRKK